MAGMGFESWSVRNWFVFALVGVLIALVMVPAERAHADDSEVRQGPSFYVDLNLRVFPSGAVRVIQTYTVMKDRPAPHSMSLWIRSTTRDGFLYRGLGLQGIKVYSGMDTNPLAFTATDTTNGTRVDIPDVLIQLRESDFRSIAVEYVLERGFQGVEFQGTFFEMDTLPGPVFGVRVAIEDDKGKGELFQAGISSVMIVDATGQKHRMGKEEDAEFYAFERHGQNFGTQIQLHIKSVLATRSLGGGGLPIFDLVGFVLPNLWLLVPAAFLLFLLITAFIYSRARMEQMGSVEPLAKAPAGLDASSAAAITYGGVSRRLYSATLLSLAHQERVLIEQDDTSGALTGLLIRKSAPLAEESKAAERVLFDRILFTRSETESLARVHRKLRRNFLGVKLRWDLRENFSRRRPVLRSSFSEWWLWPKTYQIMMVILVLGGAGLLLAASGIGVASIAKPEWWITWPVMMVSFILFLVSARWGRNTFEQHEMPFLQFLAFLDRNPDKLASISGDTRAFSVLLPFGVATGTERQVIDAYCSGQTRVKLPSWLYIKENSLETVHVNAFRDRLARIMDALVRAF